MSEPAEPPEARVEGRTLRVAQGSRGRQRAGAFGDTPMRLVRLPG